jgi:hypothetical protein
VTAGHAGASPPPPPQLRQLDFLLGSVECVSEQRSGASEPTVMRMHTAPVLGGHYYQAEGTWPGTLIIRVFGWNPVDEVLTEYYLADSGSQGTAQSPGWEGGRLVMTGSFAFAGQGTRTVRDVFTRIGEDRFLLESYLRSDDRAGGAAGEGWAPAGRFTCHRYQRHESIRT